MERYGEQELPAACDREFRGFVQNVILEDLTKDTIVVVDVNVQMRLFAYLKPLNMKVMSPDPMLDVVVDMNEAGEVIPIRN